MATILTALGDCGYGVAYRVFNAQCFGVPQRRRRIFFVGYFGDPRPAAKVLFESDCLPWDFAPSREAQTTPTTGTFQGVDSSRQQRTIAHAITTGYGRRFEPSTETYIFEWTASAAQSLNPSTVAPSLKQSNPPALYQTKGSQGVGNMGALRSSMGKGGVSGGLPFVVSSTTRPRRATPLECERLQGFPDHWTAYGITATGKTKSMKDTPRYEMLGNALAVPNAEWIAHRLMQLEMAL